MAFLENITKKVTETAKTAAKKSGELVETTKINLAISSEEDKVNKIYTQMGKEIFEAYSGGDTVPENLMEKCEEIKSIKENIENLREKVMELKGVKACVKCGAEMERSIIFCSKCGAKNEITAQEAESAPVSEAAAPKFCPDCGKPYEAGSAFCGGCGKKID